MAGVETKGGVFNYIKTAGKKIKNPSNLNFLWTKLPSVTKSISTGEKKEKIVPVEIKGVMICTYYEKKEKKVSLDNHFQKRKYNQCHFRNGLFASFYYGPNTQIFGKNHLF